MNTSWTSGCILPDESHEILVRKKGECGEGRRAVYIDRGYEDEFGEWIHYSEAEWKSIEDQS
jgi:hypothetical protein